MRKVDLLIHSAAQMVTSASPEEPKRGLAMSDPGVIANGAVAISGERIVGVGDTPLAPGVRSGFEISMQPEKSYCRVLSIRILTQSTRATGSLSLSHAFAAPVIWRSCQPVAASSRPRATREASPGILKEASRRNLAAMFSLGATTIEMKTGYGLDLSNELKLLEAIADLDSELPVDLVPTFMPAHAVPPEFEGRAADYVRLVIDEMLPAAANWYRGSHFSRESRPVLLMSSANRAPSVWKSRTACSRQEDCSDLQ